MLLTKYIVSGLKKGGYATIRGLNFDHRYNGLKAKILDFDHEKGRYYVTVLDSDVAQKNIAVKPKNLRPILQGLCITYTHLYFFIFLHKTYTNKKQRGMKKIKMVMLKKKMMMLKMNLMPI